MEEIKLDPTEISSLRDGSSQLCYIIDKSKKNGAQIGVTWNKKVFDYLFESGLSESEISRIIGVDYGDFIEEEIEL